MKPDVVAGPDGLLHEDFGDGLTACTMESDDCEDATGDEPPCPVCFPDLDL